MCDIILPRLTQRAVLEETEGLAARKSLLEDEEKRPPSEGSRASSPDLRRGRSSSLSSAGSRARFVSRSPSRSDSGDEGEVGDTRFVSRSPSLSPDRQAAMQGDRIDGDV